MPHPWRLEYRAQGSAPSVHPVDKTPFVIGRGTDCQLILSSPLVSRRHARLLAVGQSLYLEDLGSKNGTLLNGVQAQARLILKPGDVIGIGGAQLLLSCVDGADLDRTLAQDGRSRDQILAERYELTKRELELINLIVDGRSSAEISERLCISPGTVKNHLNSIYRKTDTGSRLKLAKLFQRER